MKRWDEYEVEPWRTQKLWTQFVVGVGVLARAVLGQHQDTGDEDRYARWTPYDHVTCGMPKP